MILIRPELRGEDNWGSGAYGASRGSRKHRGVDYKPRQGEHIMSICAGVVSKVGYPYGDDLSFRYVEVTDRDDYRVRVMYIEPMVTEGMQVFRHYVIGAAQELGDR